jgi:hypothetical protein
VDGRLQKNGLVGEGAEGFSGFGPRQDGGELLELRVGEGRHEFELRESADYRCIAAMGGVGEELGELVGSDFACGLSADRGCQ